MLIFVFELKRSLTILVLSVLQMQSLIQQIFFEYYSVPGIVQCDRNKTGKVPWSFHFIDGVNFSHLSERLGS